MATGRIKKELRDWGKSPIEGVNIFPSEADMFEWKVILDGPKDTPYEVFLNVRANKNQNL